MQTDVDPWAVGQVIGISNEDIGTLVYAKVAEQSFPVAGVVYSNAGPAGAILTKKFRNEEPSLSEKTAAESRSLPVIGDVTQIFKLDTTSVA